MAARNAAKHDSKISAAKDTIAQTAGGQLASQSVQTAARQSGPMVSDDGYAGVLSPVTITPAQISLVVTV